MTLALLLLMYFAIHGPFIVSSNAPKLEGPDIFVEDYTYYLDGAVSILQTDPYEKFNNKHQPIMARAVSIYSFTYPADAK